MPKFVSYNNLERYNQRLTSKFGTANGLAQLDSNGEVPALQLPAAVYNVLEYATASNFPVTGVQNKLYIDASTNNLYRWDVTEEAYVNTSFQLPSDVYNVIACEDLASFPVEGEEEKIYIDCETNNLYRWDTDTYINISSPESVKYTAQELTIAQQAQARANIGAAAFGDVPSGVVVYDEAQNLSAAQKTQARTNIGAASGSDVSDLSTAVTNLSSAVNNFGQNDTIYVKDIEKTANGLQISYSDENEDKEIELDSNGLQFDSGYVDSNDNKLYLTKNGVTLSSDIFTPFELPAGGGGGGGTTVISLSNVVRPTSVRNGASAQFSFTATCSNSSDDITVVWYVNGAERGTPDIQVSGSTFTFDAGDYLNPSTRNTVKAVMTSTTGGTLTSQWTVMTVAFSLTWGSSINPIMLYTIDENIFAVVRVSAEAGTQNIVTITVGNHSETRTVTGSRTISVELNKAWFSAGANTVTASMVSSTNQNDRAEDIQFVAIWSIGATNPIVAFAKQTQTTSQYDSTIVNYFIYDPNNETASGTIQVDSETPRGLSVNRTIQEFEYVPLLQKSYTLTLTCGQSTATMTLVAGQSQYNTSIFSDDSLRYNLDPVGHTNADADKEDFGSVTINNELRRMTFSQNFDWVNGGFQRDNNGASAFVVKKGNTVTLPRPLFGDADTNGKTIDLSFKIVNSDRYDAVAAQELDNNQSTGVILRANEGEIRMGSVSGQIFKYCEENRIDLSILVETNGNQRLVTTWLDGIPSKANAYVAGSLIQNDSNMVIGSNDCDIWIYAIRVYNSELTKQDMVQNYIASGSTTVEKINRCKENDIYGDPDENNNYHISMEQLHKAVPNLTIVNIAAGKMTVDKTDKVSADVTIQDGNTILELESANTKFMVQGTSSAAYGRSAYNLDIDFKKTNKTYTISSGAIPVNYLNIKANVASSENANNICAVDWYNANQPYLVPSRALPGIRDTMEGKPCAVFFTNSNAVDPNSDVPEEQQIEALSFWVSSQKVKPGETIFYFMGDICNSKKNKNVFGQENEGEHPTKACIECSGNDTEPQRFRQPIASLYDQSGDDGKGIWQSTEIVDGQSKIIKHFEWRMNPSSENLSEVVQSWNETVAWVASTIDNPAKFKAEVGDYFAIDSLLYHFLYLEYFAAYDNVSKNTFYSYDYDATADKYLWNICKGYDMDTILACDNDGVPFGDFGIDYGDTINGQSYFNASNNPIWINIQAAFGAELSAMYKTLRGRGAWDSNSIISKWDNYQSRRPHASMVEDAYIKYILPYQTTGVVINNTTLGYDNNYLGRMNGSKTYQRRQYLTYQTSYMDGKYGYYNKTNSMQFRTNVAAGSSQSFTVKSYAKTYITVVTDDSPAGTKKVGTGEETTFNNVSVGANSTIYVTPDKLIQKVVPLNKTKNSTFAASGSPKLQEIILGDETPNTVWAEGTALNAPSPVLKDLSIRNLVNYSNTLDLSPNVELKTVDTRGTRVGKVILPSYAPLTSVQLNACTGIQALNLKNLQTFTVEPTTLNGTDNGSNLVSIWVEGCNTLLTNTVMPTLVVNAANNSQTATRRIRITDVNWTLDSVDPIYKIATTWKGFNALGETQDTPIVTGTITFGIATRRKLQAIAAVWNLTETVENSNIWTSNVLTITANQVLATRTVTFRDDEGNAIKDKNGNDYIQYVDHGNEAYDPIVAGEVDTPIKPETGGYRYTFTGWSNLTGQITQDRIVTATFSSEQIKYTVRWYDRQGGMVLKALELDANAGTDTRVLYGASVIYDDPNDTEYPRGIPVRTDKEANGIYQVFTGWDKSTGYVTEDLNVYAQWAEDQIPTIVSHTNLKDMTVPQIYGIAKTNQASTYFDNEDYIDIPVGRDFNFSNVNSRVLLENRYFNGAEILRFNDIKLFDADAPSFTLAIDYEYVEATTNATLVSCCDSTGNIEGFRMQYYLGGNTSENQSIQIRWGDRTDIISHGLNRGIVVLRHRKGSNNLLITSDNGGRYVTHADTSSYGGDNLPNDTWDVKAYDAYNATIHSAEVPRQQATQTDAVLAFGAIAVGTQGYEHPAKGWIHWCKIWYDDLGLDNVRQLASWCHETWRMHYRGSGLYNKDDGTGLKDGASFIANAPLSQYYEMYGVHQSNDICDTTGGWRESLVRTFVNTRCFDALPYAWQSIIQPVRISTKGGIDNPNNLEVTSDKIYIPSQADMVSIPTGLISSEGHQVPWFTEDKYRVKFMGITLPDNSNVYTSAEDPTLYTDTYNVKEKDVWIVQGNNNPKCYVYISQNTASKHGYIGGRAANDTANNIVAAGAQGGLWVRSVPYWTRTSDEGNAYTVYNNGRVASAWIAYLSYQQRGVVIMFSI